MNLTDTTTSVTDPIALWAVGRGLIENGEFERAIQVFGRNADLPGAGIESWLYSAVAARRGEDLELAAAFLDSVALKEPDAARLHWQRGLLLNQERRYAEAVPHLVLAAEAAPEMATAHYQLGVALERSDQALDAEVTLRRAVELDPLLFQARYALYLLERRSDPEAARKQLVVLEQQRGSIPDWQRNDLIQLEAGELSEITWPGAEERELPHDQRSHELLLTLEAVRNASTEGAIVECWSFDGHFVRQLFQSGENPIAIGPWTEGIAVIRVAWPNGIVHDAIGVELDFGRGGLESTQARLHLKEQTFIKGSWGGTRVD